jgi:HPr kinase/phosphorylase
MKVNNELYTYHGNLLVIHSQGILIQGSAGIGKSKLTLDLLDRGHELIADDCIEICRRTHQLIGRATKQGRGYLWLPTLGLLDISLLFGKKAVKKKHAHSFSH